MIDLSNNKELHKIKSGGLLYEYCNNLPVILINEDNIEEYKNYLESINSIADMSGSDLMLMFADVCTIIDNEAVEAIKDYFLNSLSIVGYALNQISDILSLLKESKHDIILNGSSYCFVIIFLAEVFSYYCGFINHIKMLKYTSSGMIVKAGSSDNDIPVARAQATLAFLLSQEFESLREKFNVIECYRLAHSSRTLH